jgi:type II restriction enzyme
MVDASKKDRRSASRALIRVLRTTFGAEYQGDSLLIARANAYLTWYEAYERMYGSNPKSLACIIAARTIAMTIVQADVLTGEVPFSNGALSCMGLARGVDGSVDSTEKVAVFA